MDEQNLGEPENIKDPPPGAEDIKTPCKNVLICTSAPSTMRKLKASNLSILQLHIQEVKVTENPELLFRSRVVHVVWIPGPVL